MKKEIQYVLTLVGLGASLVAYAHVTFATKSEVEVLHTIIEKIDQRVYDIHKYHGLNAEPRSK